MEHKKDCEWSERSVPFNACPCDCFVTVEKQLLLDLIHYILGDEETPWSKELEKRVQEALDS